MSLLVNRTLRPSKQDGNAIRLSVPECSNQPFSPCSGLLRIRGLAHLIDPVRKNRFETPACAFVIQPSPWHTEQIQ